ncbi:hypothetical protein VR46_39470, partial [Streptomyces sp. NRRL S-444]
AQQVVAPGANLVGEHPSEGEIRVTVVLPQVVRLPERGLVDLQPYAQDQLRVVRQPDGQQTADERAGAVNPEERGGAGPMPGLFGCAEGSVGQVESDVDAPLVREGVAAAGTGGKEQEGIWLVTPPA